MEGFFNYKKNQVYCSFCNKQQGKVKMLVAGNFGVFICNECIYTCYEIILEDEDEMEDF